MYALCNPSVIGDQTWGITITLSWTAVPILTIVAFIPFGLYYINSLLAYRFQKVFIAARSLWWPFIFEPAMQCFFKLAFLVRFLFGIKHDPIPYNLLSTPFYLKKQSRLSSQSGFLSPRHRKWKLHLIKVFLSCRYAVT